MPGVHVVTPPVTFRPPVVTPPVEQPPVNLDTLLELAASINNDPHFSTTVTAQVNTSLATATGRAASFVLALGG